VAKVRSSWRKSKVRGESQKFVAKVLGK
jgi:hypothetical protein